MSALLIGGGGYAFFIGCTNDNFLETLSSRDARAFGLVHILVGGWMLFGAATDNETLKYGACKMLTKSKPCSWSTQA